MLSNVCLGFLWRRRHFGKCESLGSSPVKMSQAFHYPLISFDLLQLLYFPWKVNTFKTPEMCLYLDSEVWAVDLQLFLRDLFIILSRFLAESWSVKMSQAFHDPSINFHASRTGKVNTFKTPEMRLYFDSHVWGRCLNYFCCFPYFKFLTKINS